MGLEADAALDVAVAALRRRDLSRAELARRLRAAGVDEALQQETLRRLATAGLLDDARLASRRAETLAARGLGNAAIAARLEQEAIGPDEREAALAALEPEEARARRLAGEETRPALLTALLARRGFGEDALEAGLAALDARGVSELG